MHDLDGAAGVTLVQEAVLDVRVGLLHVATLRKILGGVCSAPEVILGCRVCLRLI